MQKTEQLSPSPATGCLARIVVIGIISLMLWCNHAFGQAPIKMSKEDSVAAGRFVDSIQTSTSILAFKTWCDANVQGKKTDFETLQTFYNLYINERFNQWLIQRKSKQKN